MRLLHTVGQIESVEVAQKAKKKPKHQSRASMARVLEHVAFRTDGEEPCVYTGIHFRNFVRAITRNVSLVGLTSAWLHP